MGSASLRSAKLFMLSLLPAAAAYSQVQFQLASTDDGSQVYFVTRLRLAAESALNLPQTPAIYRVQASGTVERFTTPPPLISNSLQGNPQVSGDGKVVSYTEYQPCIYGSGSRCHDDPATSASYLFINGQAYSKTLGGEAQISRSGRYILNYGQWSSSSTGNVSYNELRDLQTGAITQSQVRPANFPVRGGCLTSDGSILGFQGQDTALVLWNAQRSRRIATAQPAQYAIVNDAGTTVVYETGVTGGRDLRAVDIATGTEALLGHREGGWGLQPSISPDGTLVLYVAEPHAGQVTQAWLIRPDGSGRKQLTSLPEGVDEAVMTTSGRAVIAVTGGRIVRIDIQSGNVQELIGRTPTCYFGFVALMPGSILPIRGTGLARSTQVASVPLPFSLGGIQVLMDGTPLPILSIAPGEIWFQVPFELTPGPVVNVELPHSSLFEGCPVQQKAIVARAPYFFGSEGSVYLTAAHQDFTSLVTDKAPVQPGEVVHVYAAGLGEVNPPMQTGIPTPNDQLYRLAESFDCLTGSVYSQEHETLDVPFAGLAPGMIGIYQVDVRMPSQLPTLPLILNCGTPDNAFQRHGGLLPVPRPLD